MKHQATWIVSLACLLAMALGSFPHHSVAKAQDANALPPPTCSGETIFGKYGYKLEGTIVGLGKVVLNGVIAHRRDFSGNFLISGEDALNADNLTLPVRTYSGSYSIKADCTGTGVYTDSIGNTVNYKIVVVNGGQKLFFMGLDPGVIVNGVAERL